MATTVSSLLRANRVLFLAPRLMSKTCLPSCSKTPMLLGATKLHTSPNRLSEAGGMESTHWKMERGLAIALVGIVPAALYTHLPALDYAMAAGFILHGHWGMEAVFMDYLPGKRNHAILIAISCIAFAGLCNFNYNDVGLSRAITMLWE